MTALTHELKASYAFVERNFFLSRRYWGWEIAFLVYSAAGALSISFIGAQFGDARLLADADRRRDLLELPVGGLQLDRRDDPVERWEGTLEYTIMAPVHRSTHLLGSVAYAMVYGLIHTAAILVAMILFFPDLAIAQRELR